MHRLFAGAVVLTAIPACRDSCPNDFWAEPGVVESGVSAELLAVATTDTYRSYSVVAVGTAGTVVAYDREDLRVAETWTVADVDLRGVTEARSDPGSAWWVVGDGGFAAVTYNEGEIWTPLDAGTTADFHAIYIDELDGTIVVVGDDVVRVRRDTWIEPPPPEGGWGQLRGIGQSRAPGVPFFAVGLGGVIWSTEDPTGPWVAEDSGVDVDLFAVGELSDGLANVYTVAAVGADGTFLVRDADQWTRVETGRTVDFIAYEMDFAPALVLTADGEVLEYRVDTGFERIADQLEGSRDLDPGNSLIVVGDAGTVWSIGRQDRFCGAWFL